MFVSSAIFFQKGANVQCRSNITRGAWNHGM